MVSIRKNSPERVGHGSPRVVEKKKTYETNEINGKFRITSEEWNESYNNSNSKEYKEMSRIVRESLLELLEQDSQINEKVNFEVNIVGFK